MDDELAWSLVVPFHQYLWSPTCDVADLKSHWEHVEEVIEQVRPFAYDALERFRIKIQGFQAGTSSLPNITWLESLLLFVYKEHHIGPKGEKQKIFRDLGDRSRGCKGLIAFGLVFGMRTVEKRRKETIQILADEASFLAEAIDESVFLSNKLIDDCFHAIDGCSLASKFRQGLGLLRLSIKSPKHDDKQAFERVGTELSDSHSPKPTATVVAIPDDAAIEDSPPSCTVLNEHEPEESHETLAPTTHEARHDIADSQLEALTGHESVIMPVEQSGPGARGSHANMLPLTTEAYSVLHAQDYEPMSTGRNPKIPCGWPAIRHEVNDMHVNPLLVPPSSVQTIPLTTDGGHIQAPGYGNMAEAPRPGMFQRYLHSIAYADKAGLRQLFSDYQIEVMERLPLWNVAETEFTNVVTVHDLGQGLMIADINLGDTDDVSIRNFVAEFNAKTPVAAAVHVTKATHVLATLHDAEHFIDQVFYEFISRRLLRLQQERQAFDITRQTL